MAIGRLTTGERAGTALRSALLALGLLLLAAAPASALTDRERVTNHRFKRPVQVVQPPGDSERLFVVQQPGAIRTIVDGHTRDRKFLDIREMVSFGDGNQEERGLLSLAFPPDYQSSGLLYVFYSNHSNDIRVAEFQRDPSDAGHALERTKRIVLRITRPADYRHNHYGGGLAFGPDGYLWVTTGDAGAKDHDDLAQNLNSLIGKVLRIDPAPSLDSNHSIPPDNPYAGATNGEDEIWARGLRNPWRFSFDGSTLMVPDVGEDRFEELNAFPDYTDSRGVNFGWSGYEGLRVFLESRVHLGTRMPDLTYCHPGLTSSGCTVSQEGCSITGGAVAHDPALPGLAGRYVYGDFCNQRLRSLLPGNPTPSNSTLAAYVPAFSLTSVGTDNAGHIYLTTIKGRVHKLVPG